MGKSTAGFLQSDDSAEKNFLANQLILKDELALFKNCIYKCLLRIKYTHLASDVFRSLAIVCQHRFFKPVLDLGIHILLIIWLHNKKLETHSYHSTPLVHVLKSAIQALITHYLINLSDKARDIVDQHNKKQQQHKTLIPWQVFI